LTTNAAFRLFPLIRALDRVQLYAAGLGTGALVLIAGLWLAGFRVAGGGSAWLLVPFVVIAVLVEHQSITLSGSEAHQPSGLQVSVAFMPLLFVAVIFGPLAAAVIGALTMLPDLKPPYLRWFVWTANRSIISGVAGLAAYACLQLDTGAPARIVLATAAAAFVDFSLDVVLTSLTLVVRRTGSPRDVIAAAAPVAATGVPLYTVVVGVLAYAYLEVTPWSALLFFVPALAAQQLFVLYRKQRTALSGLEAANLRLERANMSFATALVTTLDARDRYTAGHSAAVAVYSRDIAERMGLDEHDQRLAYLSGLVHDIGKVGLPAGLLEKTGPLSLEERRQMEEHSVIGERILSKVEDYSEIAAIVRHHHERVDGRGYPDGLAGDSTPVLARIIAVADAYNAMTSDRPYRDAMPSRVARLRLAQAVESQFDTSVVAAFEAILASESESYRIATASAFTFAVQDRVAEIASIAAA
jgi:putative nucleotidyltransferase with HDIG domain